MTVSGASPEKQLELVARCPRCGAAMPGLAAVAQRLAERATAAAAAREAMRMAIPDALTQGLRELAADLPLLVSALRCHAGVCATSDRRAAP